jgi:hypothetical protein
MKYLKVMLSWCLLLSFLLKLRPVGSREGRGMRDMSMRQEEEDIDEVEKKEEICFEGWTV